ncbi:MAG: hypothetical protein ACTSX7_03505 [Alphaproteobacteria bacterium]
MYRIVAGLRRPQIIRYATRRAALRAHRRRCTITTGRLLGAKVGSFFGSALVAAGVGGRLAGKLIQSLPQGRINDLLARAIADEDVLRTMLMKPISDEADKIITRRLRGHLANIQSESDDEE